MGVGATYIMLCDVRGADRGPDVTWKEGLKRGEEDQVRWSRRLTRLPQCKEPLVFDWLEV